MMRYYNDKFILMLFIGFGDAVYCFSSEQHDADQDNVPNAMKDHSK